MCLIVGILFLILLRAFPCFSWHLTNIIFYLQRCPFPLILYTKPHVRVFPSYQQADSDCSPFVVFMRLWFWNSFSSPESPFSCTSSSSFVENNGNVSYFLITVIVIFEAEFSDSAAFQEVMDLSWSGPSIMLTAQPSSPLPVPFRMNCSDLQNSVSW